MSPPSANVRCERISFLRLSHLFAYFLFSPLCKPMIIKGSRQDPVAPAGESANPSDQAMGDPCPPSVSRWTLSSTLELAQIVIVITVAEDRYRQNHVRGSAGVMRDVRSDVTMLGQHVLSEVVAPGCHHSTYGTLVVFHSSVSFPARSYVEFRRSSSIGEQSPRMMPRKTQCGSRYRD